MKRWTAFVCLFLALLLPIRGALAGVMPLFHVFGHGPSSSVLASDSAHQPDHTTHTQACSHHAAAQGSHAAHCGAQQHLLCDLCNGPALALKAPVALQPAASPATRVHVPSAFFSISLPSEVKPPILSSLPPTFRF
jgi:hypothetical protein